MPMVSGQTSERVFKRRKKNGCWLQAVLHQAYKTAFCSGRAEESTLEVACWVRLAR